MIIRNNYFLLTKKYPSSQLAKGRLKYYRNLVVSKIRASKREISMAKINENLSDAKKTWKHLNSLIYNREVVSNDVCSNLCVNNKFISNKFLIAEAFNFHFTNAAKSVHNKILRINIVNNTVSHNFTINAPFVNTSITSDEIKILIEKLSNSKAKDFYGISNHTLKIHKASLLNPITRVITNDFDIGHFPNSLKIAAVTPLFKGGDKTVPNCYRPIAIAPTFSKIYEGVFISRWEKHLLNNDIINEAQFGFVDKSNTETALVHLLSTVYKNLEEAKITAAAFYDISKAFDCVDHEIFLNMNKALNLPKNVFDFIEEYFAHRKQFVRIGEYKSPQMEINAGIFQESFGPKAFIFYINGIFKLNLRGRIQLYADDTILVYAENSLVDLKLAIENDLQIIHSFFHSLKLDLNAAKTKYMIFNSRKHFEYFTDSRVDISLDNVIIERVESYKCLGLVLDEMLNFDKHIDSVYNKCIPMMYAIKRARYFLTEKLLYQIYFAHVYSHLIFLNPIWSSTKKGNMDRLFILQKKCLKFIQNKPPLADSLSLFSTKILPLTLVIII